MNDEQRQAETGTEPENTGDGNVKWQERAAGRLASVGRWLWHYLSAIVTLVAIAGAFLMGLNSRGGGHEDGSQGSALAVEHKQEYSCSMHPQIRQDEPGLCPICNMDLVPVKGAGEGLGKRDLKMSDSARILAGIETSPVERKDVAMDILMVGKVAYDETRVRTIAAWLDGRIEKLHVDYTGQQVDKEADLVDLYSPQLLVAQKELLLAVKAERMANVSELESGRTDLQSMMLEAAREKLLLWGLTAGQIAAIEERAEPSRILTITAPIGGTVVHRPVQEGMYVKEGTPLLTVADLTVVWAQLEAYESDLIWLREGQKVTLTTEAYPGVVMEGEIRFIEPFLGAGARTVAVRVEIPNPNGRLKPGMFVQGRVAVRMSEQGDELPLVIPHTAPLRTGKRAVVYVTLPDLDEPVYQGRTVLLGPRAGDYFVVKAGLIEGEEVVVHGAFKIDAALQIQAKPSMMSMPSENVVPQIPVKFVQSLQPVYQAYFTVWEGLKDDDQAVASRGLKELHEALPTVREELLEVSVLRDWKSIGEPLIKHSMAGLETQDIAKQRVQFEPLSEAVLALERTFGHAGETAHFEMYCPMAFENRGAVWMQQTKALLNPYFGAGMLRCGETREAFSPLENKDSKSQPNLDGGNPHAHRGHQ